MTSHLHLVSVHYVQDLIEELRLKKSKVQHYIDCGLNYRLLHATLSGEPIIYRHIIEDGFGEDGLSEDAC